MSTQRLRPTLFGLAAIAIAAAGLSPAPAVAQTSDLVSRTTLRVCADPADMPLSNEAGEGFENKIAELLAKDLGVPLVYTWFPQATGFYRMTLGSRKCDVVFGVPIGAEPYLNTNPYFRTTAIFFTKKDGPLAGVEALSDPKLADKKIGVTAGTAPASYLVQYGLMAKAKPYSLTVDRRYQSPAEEMVRDVESGAIDGGVLWGPIGGYFVGKMDDLVVTPLMKDKGGPPLAYRLTFGIRSGEDNWKHRLNDFIKTHQDEINKILASYSVPLIDELDQPIKVAN